MSTQYVQHISGTGPKWESDGTWKSSYGEFWSIPLGVSEHASFPRSEYRLCEPPDRWVDVTADVTLDDDGRDMVHQQHQWRAVPQHAYGAYRLRKVPICTGSEHGHEPTKEWAFKVEKWEP